METTMTVQDIMPNNTSAYDCTITFNFSPGAFGHFLQYAVNPLSYTCQPTLVLGKCHFANNGKQCECFLEAKRYRYAYLIIPLGPHALS